MARILLIEGNELVARTLQAMLLVAGHEVVLAGLADEALSSVQAQSFDLVFCDLHMQGRAGRDLALKLRELPADTRLILTTGGPPSGEDRDAHLDASFLQTCRDAVKTVVLAKPFRIEQIHTLVRDQLAAATAAKGDVPLPRITRDPHS